MALRRYNDAIRTFVSILNFIGRMRQYHTRSYQYDQVSAFPPPLISKPDKSQINKTSERMYALFAICNCLSPSKLDEQILSNAKERYADQIAKMSSPFTLTNPAAAPATPGSPTNNTQATPSPASEALAAYSELFLFACPKFITANAPPYADSALLTEYVVNPPEEPATRHLALFLDDVKARKEVPTLRSYLKLYTSLDASKLAGFLERDEEELVQLMMVMKMNSRGISRVGNEGTLLDGQVITTSDLDFVINEVSGLCSRDFIFTNRWLEHGACRGVRHQPKIRRVVCSKYRTCAKSIRRPQG
jgi:translation initiation factor 3 subunit L